MAVANNKVGEIEVLVQKYGDGIQCEHCGIKLMEAELTKNKISELDGWKDKVKEFQLKLDELNTKESSFTKLKRDFDEYEKNVLIKEKFELSLESNELKINKTKEDLRKYYEVQDKIKKNNEVDAQLVKAGLRIDELINERRSYEKLSITNQNEITNLESKIEKNNEIIAKLLEEFEKEKIYKIYLDIFGKNGISKIIMKTMMPLINTELQRLLEDSCYFNLEIRISDKNEVEFIMIDNSTGVEKLMTSGSGYEKTIASLALRSVLSKICSLPKPNVIVMDEVFGKISNDNLELVGEFFSKIKTYFEKIFVISHNPLISNWADKIVRIEKTNNISKVIQ
jgi:DNA repair exonuclease SbcCD ATPase subunit